MTQMSYNFVLSGGGFAGKKFRRALYFVYANVH